MIKYLNHIFDTTQIETKNGKMSEQTNIEKVIKDLYYQVNSPSIR